MRFPEIALAPSFMNAATSSEDHELMIYKPFVPNNEILKQEAGEYDYKVIARLKTGITLAQARAELNTLQ